MDKNKVYELAKSNSVRNPNTTYYVWENDFGEWLQGSYFPSQYLEIIADFLNGVDIHDS
jgi:hypothetical protein